MADTTLFALTAFTSGADGDVLPAVDVSDTAQSAQGSTRKITFANLKTYMSASPTLVTPNIGTPSAGVLTNCTGLPTAGIVDAAVTLAKMANLAQDQFIVRTTASTGVPQTATVTAAARTVLDDTTVGAMVDTLGGASASGTGGLVRTTSATHTTPTFSGIYTSDGASVTTANAIGALAIDVTKGLNTKSVSADSTFTFSGTPATANTWFGIHITNTDAAVHIITFPSAFSQVTQAARTTCPIAASGQLFLMFRYDGSAYKVFGDSPFLSNFTATAAPAVTDDLDLGYGTGSLWLDATGNATYICESAANGAAVWHGLGGAVADGAITLAKMADLAQDQFIVRTTASTGVPQTATVTAAARTVLDDTSTAAMLTTLGAQPVDADLTTIAGLTATTDNFLQAKSSAWASRTVAQVLTDLQGTGADVDAAGFRGLPQNSQSAAYTTVLADAGKHLYHPGADTTARTFTIDSNANVAYEIGTTLTFVNDTSAGVITIAITSDTLVLAGAGTTGSRTLAANGIATAIKMTSTRWMINGTGLT